MWKTATFQQLFALLPCGKIGGKLCLKTAPAPSGQGAAVDYVTAAQQAAAAENRRGGWLLSGFRGGRMGVGPTLDRQTL